MPAMLAVPSGADAAGRSWTDPRTLGWLLAATGAGAYALALVAMLPARVLLPHATDAAGTVWRGEAALGGGHVAAWHASLLDSLARLGIAGRWTIDGPGSALQGGARWGPFAGVALDHVAGRAGWPLVALAAPSLPFACDFGLRVALDRVALATRHQAGAGSVSGETGTCSAVVRGVVRAVPRVVAILGDDGQRTTGVITPWANRALHLADFTIENGGFRLHTTAAGAALIPGSTGPSDLEIEL